MRDALWSLVKAWPGVAQKRMFGCPSFTAEGELFSVVSNEAVTLTKLTGAEKRGAPPGQPFFTGANRPPLRTWHQVRVGEPADVKALEPWVRRSYEAAREAAAGKRVTS